MKAKWFVVVCAALCAWGCGQFVEYGEGAPPPVDATPLGGGEVEVGDLSELNHYAWGGLVASFTVEQDGNVLVDYEAWSEDEEAIAELDRYLGVLASVDASNLSSPEQRQAYWINAYNAATIRGVIADFEGDAAGFSVITSDVSTVLASRPARSCCPKRSEDKPVSIPVSRPSRPRAMAAASRWEAWASFCESSMKRR